MTATKQIPTSHNFSTEKSELKEFPVNETLLQSCSTYKEQSKDIIVDKFFMEDKKPESKGIISNECSTDEGES